MSARTLAYTTAVAVFGLAMPAIPARAQFVPTSSMSGRPAYAHYPPVDPRYQFLFRDTVVQNVPPGDRNPGIFLTSINYPGVYGAYTYGVAAASFNTAPTASWQSFAPRPTLYRSTAVDVPVGYAPATIRVLVPGHADVYFQDEKVPGSGFVRELSVPPMSPNTAARFEVRARWKEGDQTVGRRELVRIHGGETVVVDLGASASATPPAEGGTSEMRAVPLPAPARR